MAQEIASRADMASETDRTHDNHPVLRCHELHAEPSAYSNQASKLYNAQNQMTDDGKHVYNLKIGHKNHLRTEWNDKYGPRKGQPGWQVPEFMKHRPTDVDFDVNQAMAIPTMKSDQGMYLRQSY